MKKLLLILGIVVSLLTARIVFGQNTEGVIAYEIKVNVHRTLPKEREEMKKMIPEFRTSKHQLFFSAEASLYKTVEDEDEDIEQEGGGMRMRIQHPSIEIYSNHATSQSITQREFMGREYLIADSVKILPWKFGIETKTVMGYECKQATYYNEKRKQQIVAWYTTQLRPFLGPETFNTLPGAVLEVNVNEGERTLLAKNIEMRQLKKNEIKIPASGKRMSPVEFQKIVDEHTERVRANGGNVMIQN